MSFIYHICQAACYGFELAFVVVDRDVEVAPPACGSCCCDRGSGVKVLVAERDA